MRSLFVLFFTTLLSTQCFAQATKSQSIPEQIVKLERQFAEAIQTRDTNKTKRFMAESYFLAIAVEGMPLRIVPRELWLVNLVDYVTTSFTIDDIKVNVYGKTAIATMLCTQKATVRGRDRSGQFMLTDIWIRKDKGWKIAERHSSRPEATANVRPQ